MRSPAERTWTAPDGRKVTVSRHSLDRWIRHYRTGGFQALVPQPPNVCPRTDAQVLELAAALKKENPARTAAQVVRILRAQTGWSPSERTLQRYFARLGIEQVRIECTERGLRPVRGIRPVPADDRVHARPPFLADVRSRRIRPHRPTR